MTYRKRLLRSFEQLSRLVLSEESVESTLDLVSRLAVETIPGCAVASVSLVKRDAVLTVGSSDRVALKLDAIQYETQEGPCLDAIDKDATWFQIDEMSTDAKWPSFCARASQHGFESLLALTLRIDADTLGALNLYGRHPRSFTEEDRDFGAIYAAHASVALARAQASPDGTSHEPPNDALATQEIIGRAVGILMEGEFRSAEEALDILESRAAQLNVRLRDSAQEVIKSADKRRAELQLPAGFYDRVMGRAKKEMPRKTLQLPDTPMLLALLLAAVLAVGSVFLGWRLIQESRANATLRSALDATLTADGDAQMHLVGPRGEAGDIVASGRGSMLIASGLAEPPSERGYQLWLIEDNEIITSHVFDVDEGVAVVELDESPAAFDAARVTLEDAEGATQPSTRVVLDSG